MQKIWTVVSNFGTSSEKNSLNRRTTVLINQMNLVVFYTMLLLFIAVIVTAVSTDGIIYFGTLRVLVMLIVSFLNLLLSRYGYVQLSRLSLIYISPVVFLLGPTLIGYVEEESYTYYNYVLICVSIIPQLLVHPKKERYLFWISMLYYFVLVVTIDKIMVHFSINSYPIVDRINTFYPWFKIAHITLFVFINASIYYLRSLNFRYEEELNKNNNDLDLQNIELRAQKEEIERHKDELIAKEISTWQKLVRIISHEIVNSAIPITNLAGMTAQMLENESGEVEEPENIGREVTKEIHQGLKIIESRTFGLINFVKATKSLTNIPKPNFRKVSINDLFDRIALFYSPRFKNSGIAFQTRIERNDMFINADLELIEQVIINLIQNSMDAMDETAHPELTLSAEAIDSHIVISVRDNGRGISADVLGKIFLPFYSTKESNSGIGLSLSQQIMMLHRGRLEVNSELKEGARFDMMF